MISETVVIRNKQGIHLRVASIIVQESNRFISDIYIKRNNERTNCKSILGLISMAIPYNQEVTLEIDGDDESTAFTSIKETLTRDYSSLLSDEDKK